MFVGGRGQNKTSNASGFTNLNSDKSKIKHPPTQKKGFLLNFGDDDDSPDESSQKSKLNSNLEKLKSLFDIDSGHNINDNSSHTSFVNNTNDFTATNSVMKSTNNISHDNSLSLNIFSNSPFNEAKTNKAQQGSLNEASKQSSLQGFSLSNADSLKYDKFSAIIPNDSQTKQIEDLKMQMKKQQQQIEFLLQQQQQQQQQQIASSFPIGNPNLLDSSMININNFDHVSNSNKLLNDESLQGSNPQNQLSDKTETKNSESSRIASFDFSKGDTPSFCVKFNFGTGKQFISRTKPSKPFIMCNFNNFSFSKSKTDNSNKKGGFDYTDSFLFKMHSENSKTNQNEKNILQVPNIKLYKMGFADKNKKRFILIGHGKISITVTSNVYRIIVRHDNIGNCVLNTRIFPNITPKINNNIIQIVGQTSDNNNVDDKFDANDIENKNCKEKESALAIYKICFPTNEKANEFYQCISLVK